MRNKSDIVLKAFLEKSPTKEALLRFLPESEQAVLFELPEVEKNEELADGLLEKVHWSWFLPTLKTFPEREQQLFLSVMPPHSSTQLALSLSIKKPSEKISDVALGFLREQLLLSLSPHERLLPLEYLPLTPLNRLLRLSKKELIRLIDHLALYDLAYEMRQIVETKILKKLYSFLSEEQKMALKKILVQKETNPLPKLGLEKWEGTDESLRIMLHRRGLMRFSLALSGEDPDLIWTICHQLDIGRGGALFKLCGKEKTPARDTVLRQIEELLL